MSRNTISPGIPLYGGLRTICLVLVVLSYGCASKSEQRSEPVGEAAAKDIATTRTTDAEPTEPLIETEHTPVPPPPNVDAPPPNATRSASGLAWLVFEPGRGPRPSPGDLVTLAFTAWRADGSMIDSTVTRGKPQVFELDRLIPGWREGILMMAPGEKRLFWVPAELAHGKGDAPQNVGMPSGNLVFETELIRAMPVPEPPSTPTDVAAVPNDASRSETGLASRRLRKGNGVEHPTVVSEVTMHYSGWTKDGKLFETSITQGEPLTVALFKMPSGWVEGLHLMVVGEKRRLWMPEALAYPEGEAPPGQPGGMLVFDVELLAFEDTPSIGVGIPSEAQRAQ